MEGVRAGKRLQERGAVVDALPYHGADDAEIVGACADMRKKIAHRKAALPVVFEVPQGFHQRPGLFIVKIQRAIDGQGLAVVAVETRLGVERVNAERPSVHEEKDYSLRLRGEMGRFLRQGIYGKVCRPQVRFLRQERGQRENSEPAGGVP